MEMFRKILLSSIGRYQDLYDKTVSAVTFAKENNHKSAVAAILEFQEIQKEIETIDGSLSSLITKEVISSNLKLWNERKNLMQTILDYNHKMLPHLNSILAMQRDEIGKIKKGMRGISGYQTGAKHTGKHIKNSI